MKPFLTIMSILLPLMAIAIGVDAYSNPSSSYTTDTDVVPVTIGNANQVKIGGLGTTAFIARDNALFAKTMIISGVVRGGDACGSASAPCTTDSTVYFGDTNRIVNLGVENVVDARGPNAGPNSEGTLTSKALVGIGTRQLCADGLGTVLVCY